MALSGHFRLHPRTSVLTEPLASCLRIFGENATRRSFYFVQGLCPLLALSGHRLYALHTKFTGTIRFAASASAGGMKRRSTRPLRIPFRHPIRCQLNSRWYPPCIQSTRTVAEITIHKHFEKRHQLMALHVVTQQSSTDPDQAIVLTGARSVGSASVAARAGAGSCSTVAC